MLFMSDFTHFFILFCNHILQLQSFSSSPRYTFDVEIDDILKNNKIYFLDYWIFDYYKCHHC